MIYFLPFELDLKKFTCLPFFLVVLQIGDNFQAFWLVISRVTGSTTGSLTGAFAIEHGQGVINLPHDSVAMALDVTWLQTLAVLTHESCSTIVVNFVWEASLLDVSPLYGLPRALEIIPNLRRDLAMGGLARQATFGFPVFGIFLAPSSAMNR